MGNVVVEVLHTPGHTPEHVSLLVTDTTRGPEPGVMLALVCTCTCLQSSALVLAIEPGFGLTLSETGAGLVLTIGETGLTFGETYSRSRATGAD